MRRIRSVILLICGLMNNSSHPSSSLPRLLLVLAVVACSLALFGCSTNRQAGYYNPAPASTARDALETAEGGVGRTYVQAPSQIQIQFRSTQTQTGATGTTVQVTDALTPAGQAQVQQAVEQAAMATQRGLITQPETFFGTLPCFHRDMRCNAQQVTLTLAPNGRWRARVAYLQSEAVSGKAETAQGCWQSLPSTPPSILLLGPDRNVRAKLSMTSAEVLRLQSIDGQTPNLTYTLSRQPDLDPIKELDGVAAPACK